MSEATITAYDLACLLGGEDAHERAVLRATLKLDLNFLKLTRADCERVLDYVADNKPEVRWAARFAKPKLVLTFAQKATATVEGGGAERTPLRLPSAEELRPVHKPDERRLAVTTRTGEFRRSDFRRFAGKRFRRTQVVGLLVDGGLYQEEAETLVEDALRNVPSDSAYSMDLVTLEKVLQSIEASDARLRSYTDHVRNALMLTAASGR